MVATVRLREACLVRPDTLQIGKPYLWKGGPQGGGGSQVRVVVFQAYRPCAAEVLVSWAGKRQVIWRRQLYSPPPSIIRERDVPAWGVQKLSLA